MSKHIMIPLDQPGIPEKILSPRMRSQLVYFATVGGFGNVPTLGENEYWFDADEVKSWLEDGVISLVSPLDTANMTEVELSEEQEEFLGWLAKNGVKHVRIEER
jgi:hypothetical protein